MCSRMCLKFCLCQGEIAIQIFYLKYAVHCCTIDDMAAASLVSGTSRQLRGCADHGLIDLQVSTNFVVGEFCSSVSSVLERLL